VLRAREKSIGGLKAPDSSKLKPLKKSIGYSKEGGKNGAGKVNL
jgi:hypothetical protein